LIKKRFHLSVMSPLHRIKALRAVNTVGASPVGHIDPDFSLFAQYLGLEAVNGADDYFAIGLGAALKQRKK
jgi:hypothetical protein